jgi:hypothetical protein
VQTERHNAVLRYLAEDGLDQNARVLLEAIRDGLTSPADPLMASPERRAALIDQMHRDNLRTIATELAIHEHWRAQQPVPIGTDHDDYWATHPEMVEAFDELERWLRTDAPNTGSVVKPPSPPVASLPS